MCQIECETYKGNWYKGYSSLHEFGLSFNPERQFKFNSCLHEELSWALNDHARRVKISFRIETLQIHVPTILLHLYTYISITWIKLHILLTILNSAIMDVDFIPNFIQEWNFDSSLHDSESTFHSGSSVQSGMKNGMNSIRNELQLNPDSCKQI